MSSGEGPLREPLGQATGGGEVEESNLGPMPTLQPELEHFLEAPTPMWGAGDRQGSPLEPCDQQLQGVARMAGPPGQYA